MSVYQGVPQTHAYGTDCIIDALLISHMWVLTHAGTTQRTVDLHWKS